MEFGNVAWGQSIDEAWRDEGAPPRSPCSSLHYKRKKKMFGSLSPSLSFCVHSVGLCVLHVRVCAVCFVGVCTYIYL